MPNWLGSMQRTYEYYVVDPGTWKDVRKLDNIKSSSIVRDSSVETLGSASMNTVGSIGECYVRIYLVTIQNGQKERFPLATVLVQTPAMSFNGKTATSTVDAYTPLLELKENPPPIGYSRLKDENIMQAAYEITREHVRAPVVKPICEETLADDFVSNTSDTWLTFTEDLIMKAKHEFALDDMGRILFAPKQEIASLQPVWTYTDDNSSILHPEVSMDQDLYGIPNVVEVVYSSQYETIDGTHTIFATARNEDPNSPTSVINRGREIIYRDTRPAISGEPTQHELDEYAKKLLEELSTIECNISYSHGYCPVRLGDCVRLNYTRAGLTDVKAKVVYQSISCDASCRVTEKAVYTKKLWG